MTIAESVAAEIEERRRRLVGRPDRELLEHLLVAVQRERIAAVGYDVDKLGERIGRAPLPEDAKRIVTRAITQIWLDENQHARYVLGVLLRQRALLVQLGARSEDIEGVIGGWMTAVTQHTTWSEAPAPRLTALLLEAGARLGGRIPEEALASLTRMSLAAWCAFSADAEESAVLSFARILELAQEVLVDPARAADCELPPGFLDEVLRMQRDERAHREVFLVFARELDENDGLREGSSVDALRAALTLVPGWFAGPTGLTATDDAAHPICSGGVVAVARGEAKVATFDRALAEAGLFDVIDARGGTDVEVAIKLDLMLAYHHEDRSSYVDPELVERLVDILWERGYRRIVVCDAQNVYGRFYGNRSIEEVASYVGLEPNERYRLVDLATEQEPHAFTHGMGIYTIARTWRDAGARITFAKLKTHPFAIGQLALRNTGTVVPQDGAYFLSERLADFSQLTAAVLHDFPPHFAIIDGFENAADGLAGVIADPTPKDPHVILAGADAASVDCVAFSMMGERDPGRAPDLKAAIALFGDPRGRFEVVGDPSPLDDWDRADAGLLARPLAALASPVYASMSQHGSLFTAAVDAKAFPPIGETLMLSAARRALRVLLGIDR